MILIDKVKSYLKENPINVELGYDDLDIWKHNADLCEISTGNIVVNYSISIEQVRVPEYETNSTINKTPFIAVSKVEMYVGDTEVRLSDAQELHLISIIETNINVI